MKENIIIFENNNIKLNVNLKDETVWLNQQQMAILFGKAKSTINEHIKNIYEEKELLKKETLKKFGNSEFNNKPTNYYNLDMIISVGYRVKSQKGIIFRKWATNILKKHLIKGYTVNQKRLDFLEKKVKLIDIASRINHKLSSNEAQGIIKTINNYSSALDLLDNYDHKVLEKPSGTKKEHKITYEDCLQLIDSLKFKNDSSLFALEKDKGLESIINNIYQTYDGKDVYRSVEEKAANFLYLITKNHTFIDGNKRIAAILFIYFLDFNNVLYKNEHFIIDNNTLVATTLLIAQSNPKEKDIMIDLIMNFLV